VIDLGEPRPIPESTDCGLLLMLEAVGRVQGTDPDPEIRRCCCCCTLGGR
jgi:hypothetical protein